VTLNRATLEGRCANVVQLWSRDS